MLLTFRTDQANRRRSLRNVILCAGLFQALLLGQTPHVNGWPATAASLETAPYPGQNEAFSNTRLFANATSSFAPESISPIRSSLDRTDIPKPRQSSRGLWIASIVVLAGANFADAQSSWRKDEANRTLAGTQGTFGTKGALIKGGVNSLWVIGQLVSLRKNPTHRRLLAVVNFAAASIFVVAAYRNYGIPSTSGGAH